MKRVDIDRMADGERGRDVDALPVHVEAIIAAGGVRVGRNHYDGMQSSFILRVDGGPIVGVNTRTSPRRLRFALAHAYGHLVLGHDRRLIVCHSVHVGERVGSMATVEQEFEANWFAGSLLMPDGPLRAAMSEHLDRHDFESRDELIGKLAAEFGVSAEAMGWRLMSLNIISG